MSKRCDVKIVLASRNRHKIKELEALLNKYTEGVEVISLDEAGIFGEIEENGSDFRENALIKARAAAASGYIGMGDDSGLCVRALGGAPGIYSARYAGEHGNDSANNRLLLENLKGKTDRYAEFVCSIACVFPDGREICVDGKVEGRIREEPSGEGGFGYDPLFFYEPFGKTLAQTTPEEKNSVSHRGRAIEALALALREKK